MTETIACSTCGKVHPLHQSELAYQLPDEIFALSEEERNVRCNLSADLCGLDQTKLFLRGLLSLPVSGRLVPYRIGVWAEISIESFQRVYELWDDPQQSKLPAFPGTLSNTIPLQTNSTLGLKLLVQLTGPDTRPEFRLEPADHALYREQTEGIDEHRAILYSDRSSHVRAV